MKRRAKTKMSGTLRGRPVPIPTIKAELKRSFHSTPDLANSAALGSVNSVVEWGTTFKPSHHSQDDMHRMQPLARSLTRLNLPPPDHPPPAPPIGQIVKVDVSKPKSEYESTTVLKKEAQQDALKAPQKDSVDSSAAGEIMSSFKPEANAKLYASPQELKLVAIRREEAAQAAAVAAAAQKGAQKDTSPYATTGQPMAPPIPDPDYSLSESEGEGETIRNVKIVPVKSSVEYQEAGIFIGNTTIIR